MEGYARLQWWEVYNFMSISRGKCEFDERGIINIKGYNDSGKSAMLRALDVLFFNIRPNSQVNFIKDGCDYFRVVAHFEDGVTIVRDKYLNGQSLYEMSKDDELLYTTKVNGVLSRVTEVPEPIRVYLGLISFDGTYLNSRSCFEKQFLVQTSGSENYKMLNSVLRSEELATAGELLNNDKNRLASDISSLDSQLTAYKSLYEDGKDLTEEMITYLENLNCNIDNLEYRQSILSSTKGISENLKGITIYDEVQTINSERFNILYDISELQDRCSSIVVSEEVPVIKSGGIDSLLAIKKLQSEIGNISDIPVVPVMDIDKLKSLINIGVIRDSMPKTTPEVPLLDGSRYDMLVTIISSIEEMSNLSTELSSIESELAKVNEELSGVVSQGGTKFVKCPDCGRMIEVD